MLLSIYYSQNYASIICQGLYLSAYSLVHDSYSMNVSCEITYNRNDCEHSDLVAVHGKGIDLNNLPDPSKRLPHQCWVYYNHESPANTRPINIHFIL